MIKVTREAASMSENGSYDDEVKEHFAINGIFYEYFEEDSKRTTKRKGGFVIDIPKQHDEASQVIEEIETNELIDINVMK